MTAMLLHSNPTLRTRPESVLSPGAQETDVVPPDPTRVLLVEDDLDVQGAGVTDHDTIRRQMLRKGDRRRHLSAGRDAFFY